MIGIMDQASPALAQSRAAVTIDRRTLFRTAWLYARWDANSSGRKLRAVFPDALRRAWATFKDRASVESRVSAEARKIIAEIHARKAADTFRPIRQQPWRFANAGM
jgi:hypothetical protein